MSDGTEAAALAELEGIGEQYGEAEYIPRGEGEEVEQEEAKQPELPTAELLFPIVSLTFDVMAPRWGIQHAEKQAMAESYAAVFDKYMPQGVGGVELAALLLTVSIVGPRVAMGMPRKDPKPEGEAGKGSGQEGGREAAPGEPVASGST